MDSVQGLHNEASSEPRPADRAAIQAGGYLLELSLDWLVLRASENIHHLLGQSHVTLIGEPLGRFVHAQALHDLRNLFSRLSGTTGIARAYAVRLTDDPDLVDVAFQVGDGRVLFEAVPSEGRFGEYFGTVGGLVAGMSERSGQALLDAGVRRMRALTGYDRVMVVCGDERAESSRGAFAEAAEWSEGLPAIVTDTTGDSVALFPRDEGESSTTGALLRAPEPAAVEALGSAGTRATLRVPFSADGQAGEFRCENRAPKQPSFELHAAAELFAQLFAMQLEIDRLENG